MIYFIFELFLLFFFIAELPNSNAKDLYDNDIFLLGFVKEQSNFKEFCIKETDDFSDYVFRDLTQKYEVFLGIVYWLKKNWHCDKVGKEFPEYDQKECRKYRNYLDIVYEYLFLNHAGFPAMKPMFYFDKFFTFRTLTETVKSLTIISKFYFDSEFAISKGHKLETLFVRYYEPKLFNENKLNYEANSDKQNETFQEIIVQMGIELKLENEINDTYTKLIRHKFDKTLEQMLQRAEELSVSSGRAASENNTVQFNESNILRLYSAFDQDYHTLNFEAFIAFLRGEFFFEQICLEMQKEGILKIISGQRGGDTFEESKEYLAQSYETQLGHLYLMRQKWNCEKIVKQIGEKKDTKAECEKNCKNLNIFHEYLFKIYSKTQVPALALQFPIVRPLFFDSLFVFVRWLHKMSQNLFMSSEIEQTKYWLNEDEMGFEAKEDANLMKTLRQKFDNKLKTMLGKARNDEIMHNWKAIDELRRLKESPFYERLLQVEDEAFIAFVKGESNFEHLWRLGAVDLLSICKGLPKDTYFPQKLEHLKQKYEAHLGVMYLMREKWKCDQIGEKFGIKEKTECQKYQKYLIIFYEFLFSLHANDDVDSEIALHSLLLIQKVKQFGTLIDVIKCFNRISKFYFDSKFRQPKKYKLENSKQKLEKIFSSEKERKEKKKEKLKEFDEKLKKMLQQAEEKGKEEEAKLKKMEEEMEEKERTNALIEQLRMKRAAHNDKYGTLFDSPFYGTTPI